jgi:hypothetical protein
MVDLLFFAAPHRDHVGHLSTEEQNYCGAALSSHPEQSKRRKRKELGESGSHRGSSGYRARGERPAVRSSTNRANQNARNPSYRGLPIGEQIGKFSPSSLRTTRSIPSAEGSGVSKAVIARLALGCSFKISQEMLGYQSSWTPAWLSAIARFRIAPAIRLRIQATPMLQARWRAGLVSFSGDPDSPELKQQRSPANPATRSTPFTTGDCRRYRAQKMRRLPSAC